MKLPSELKKFDSRYDIALAQGVFCAVNGTALSEAVRWTVQTVTEPEVDDEATTCVEINRCVGCTTPSSKRRIDGMEIDATIQNAP